MAFWNAPLDDRDHAANACTAALRMIEKMEHLNTEWKERASMLNRPFQRVNIGIGINTGRCCVGNLGSTVRFDYSAIGDEVNVASRFESLTKIYGVSNLIGEHTLAMAHAFHALELDIVQVKGRARSTRIYTLFDSLHAGQTELDRLSARHQEFLSAYRNQQWDGAERLLDECRSIGISSLATCYQMFQSRILTLRRTALPANWDGSFILLEK
jgi:adenylate cyclase